jgi:hypothetical protein
MDERNPMSDTESSEPEDESTSKGSALTTTNEKAEISDEEREQLENERQERLDPENRPENAEVDNTGREFDVEKNDFTYAPGEEPDDVDHAQAVIGADRPEGVESDADER